MYGKGKLEGMRNFAESHDIDLAESWAYSDSASDLPMLRAVGNAVAVNPDTELAEVARDEGWQVMRFEKLGRRLTIAAATVTAALVGGGAATFARRRSFADASPLARDSGRPRLLHARRDARRAERHQRLRRRQPVARRV